jgi:hypothetical protein
MVDKPVKPDHDKGAAAEPRIAKPPQESQQESAPAAPAGGDKKGRESNE